MKTIVYIEDNQTNLKLIEQLIKRKSDLKLLSAEAADSGMEIIKQHIPDLILLDINLPGMDGFEVLEALRQSADTKHIPVIAVTANAMPMDIEKGEAAGFDEYITKPINVSEFYSIIDKYLTSA